jgi:hypothetical protein
MAGEQQYQIERAYGDKSAKVFPINGKDALELF